MAQFWYSSARGRRPSMEDMHVTSECPVSKWILFAVCDGHGGTAVVKYLEKVLSTRVLASLSRASTEHGGPSMPIRPSYLRQCLKLLVISLDTEIERAIKTPEARGSGSTLILLAYQPLTRQIVIANVGDSRAVLSLPVAINPTTVNSIAANTAVTAGAAGVAGFIGGTKQLLGALGASGIGNGSSSTLHEKAKETTGTISGSLPIVAGGTRGGGGGVGVRFMGAAVAGVGRRLVQTKDHKPDDKGELLRVTAAGSFVSKGKRVGGILALSRAMGDFSLKRSLRLPYDPVNGAVCAVPDVQVGYINGRSSATAILACDGIWDVLSSEEAIDIAEESLAKKTNPAETLVHVAFQKFSTDNLTCLVVRLHPRLLPPTTSLQK